MAVAPLPPAPRSAYGGKAPLLMGITWAEGCIATLVVAARVYASFRLVDRRPGWDLLWILVTWLMALTAQILLTVSCVYGAGNHFAAIPTWEAAVQAIKWNWMGQLVAIMAIGFAKVAVAALILGLQEAALWRRPKRWGWWYRWGLHFIWATNMVINVAEVVLVLFQCQPIGKLWNARVEGVCAGRMRSERVGFFQGAWGAASDVALAVYPMFIFWSLEISVRNKVFLSALTGGGLIASVAGILKTVFIKNGPLVTDPTYQIYPLWISAFTEMWLILILSSIPQLRILFVRKLKRPKRRQFSTTHLRTNFLSKHLRRWPWNRHADDTITEPTMEHEPHFQPFALPPRATGPTIQEGSTIREDTEHTQVNGDKRPFADLGRIWVTKEVNVESPRSVPECVVKGGSG